MIAQRKQLQHRIKVVSLGLEDVLLDTVVEDELQRELSLLATPLLSLGCLNVSHLSHFDPVLHLF